MEMGMPVANLATGIALHWRTAFGKQEFLSGRHWAEYCICEK